MSPATPPNLMSPTARGEFSTAQPNRLPQGSTAEAAVECFRQFARERPEAVAMWAFGLGFVLGWKLRIW